MMKSDPQFDQGALKDMPNEWVNIIASVIIPKLRLALLDEKSTLGSEKAIIEIQSSGMRTKALLGQDWQEVELSFGRMNVIDNYSGSGIFHFLTETVFPGDTNDRNKDALIIEFK